MADTQTEAATGAAILKEMVDVANSAAFWVRTPSANVKAVAAYVDHLQSDLESSILAHRAWPVQIEQLRAENKAMRECIDAAEMAKSRIDAFADKANAGEIHHSARELSRAVWAAFTEFETARAALQGKASHDRDRRNMGF